MNLVSYKSDYIDFYTYLDPLFQEIPELLDFFYLISDFEINYSKNDIFKKEYIVISGNELSEIVQSEKIQFIWAAISAFKKIPRILENKMPLSEAEFIWTDFDLQYEGALFEIICWDSSATLFKEVPDDIGKAIIGIYPDIELK